MTRIQKLYLSNFLTGLVFWYGIEKLFMRSIGIDAIGIGVATAFLSVFNLITDIPAGILADKWSRKGMLMISTIALLIADIVLGTSHGLPQYILGYAFYGINIVSTSGTYQAIIYDGLHEEQRSSEYSKVMGRAYALFLVGAGVANIFSGFIAHRFGLPATYFVTTVSCLLNCLVIASIVEPKFHKPEHKEGAIRHVHAVSSLLARQQFVRRLAIVMSALGIVEAFKIDFGQLYFLRYESRAQVIGLLWAVYAFTWALGSALAHRWRLSLTPLVVATVAPLVGMALLDSPLSLALFMVQAVASATLLNQGETQIQNHTPSAVRASVLSVLSVAGRVVSIPAILLYGWIFNHFGAFVAVRCAAAAGIGVLLYWLFSVRNVSDVEEPGETT